MRIIRGVYRLTAIVLIILGGTALILPTIWLPFRIRGIKPSAWGVTIITRFFMLIFKVRYICLEPEKFRRLEGFVFPNHSTYLDILMMTHLIPMRFVAKEEVKRFPIVGALGKAIGCVFVKRENKESRAQARVILAKAERFPPIVLFPEGKTGSGETLQEFRYGAFEIAVENEIPFLPCVILFDKPEYVRWLGEKFPKVIWRLASRPGWLTAKLVPLDVIHPKKEDDARKLAEEVYQEMSAVYEKGLEN
ncbi:MAG: 1-acyl-sn-glycerol-3-phosphate acyltransferase [Candidatus Promineifilaceae bacterium]